MSARAASHGAHLLAAPNRNALWAGLLVEELVRQGVGLFCLAPGSRSAPLAWAVVTNPRARALVHFDERGAAFAALGFARATGQPACWITTSGTAVANGLPAAVEASADGVPLLLLTADRPPELRDTGANQTIPQPGLFGAFARWSFDLPAPSADVDPAFVLTTAAQAVHRTRSPAGPVHVNAMFREPLAPEPDGTNAARVLAPLDGWIASGEPYTRYEPAPSEGPQPMLEGLAARLEGVEQGLVVLGKTDDPAVGPAAARLAEALGWPLLPDVGSQARLGPALSNAIAHYDLALGSPSFAEGNRLEAVLHVGGRVTSKRLLQAIEAARPEVYVVVRPDPERYDPAHRVTHRLQAEPAALCEGLARELIPAGETGWLRAWKAADRASAGALEAYFVFEAALSEPGVARAVSALTPDGHGLVVASSMPIRDLDAYAMIGGPRLRVAANRGASGIDGTVATAAGFARGLGRPTTLLLGDLALLHDLNSLALLRRGPPVTLIAVNNDGGGIFSFLPIAQHEAHFEDLFGTPHGLGFEDAARLFGLGYARPATPDAFSRAYREALESGRSTLIEVRTDRRANVALHRELNAAVARAVDEAG
ncbi:MAG TPA: 2-succinyl-5-enolpyruvyl-6-hydroxy-3-cyclohexene-1-carboxylic-acid synthase [Rubricoccaceae bacterium]|nr:2-succinyl-5-enolpyruvyl-6-hydroxy-3-cyclohexene-1-carboxylic-acid synthase [Rubricoccaceae bacterium]